MIPADILVKAVTAVMLTFPKWYGDGETTEERRTRTEVLAEAQVSAVRALMCSTPEEDDSDECRPYFEGHELPILSALITIGRFESAFAKHIHDNKCRVRMGECDGGRAKSPWQFHATSLVRDLWVKYVGSDYESTYSGAKAAGIILSRSLYNCGTWQGAFSQYATGQSCKWSGAEVRHKFFKKVDVTLRAEIAHQRRLAAGKE